MVFVFFLFFNDNLILQRQHAMLSAARVKSLHSHSRYMIVISFIIGQGQHWARGRKLEWVGQLGCHPLTAEKAIMRGEVGKQLPRSNRPSVYIFSLYYRDSILKNVDK